MAIEFAREDADVVVEYLEDEEGAEHTREQVEAAGRRTIVVQTEESDENRESEETGMINGSVPGEINTSVAATDRGACSGRGGSLAELVAKPSP
jgi:hypothetical protein